MPVGSRCQQSPINRFTMIYQLKHSYTSCFNPSNMAKAQQGPRSNMPKPKGQKTLTDFDGSLGGLKLLLLAFT